MESLTTHAPAKINLSLEVLRRRADGYHEVTTVLQTISLADEITVTRDDQIVLECTLPGLSGEHNLVLRAVRELRRRFPNAPGARIVLRKRIPVAAGLGGGSSDAAAVLRALVSLWELPSSEAELHDIAAGLGSDVPFFQRSGTAWATGRGEQLEPLPPPVPLWLALIPHEPTLPDKTRRLYAALSPIDFGTGQTTQKLVQCLRSGAPLDPDLFVNSFTAAAMRIFPGLRDCVQRVEQIANATPLVAGSGPTTFLLYRSEREARNAVASLAAEGIGSILAITTNPVVA